MTLVQLYATLGVAWGAVFARYVYGQLLAPKPADREMAYLNARLYREQSPWMVRAMFGSILVVSFVMGALLWVPMVFGAASRVIRRHA